VADADQPGGSDDKSQRGGKAGLHGDGGRELDLIAGQHDGTTAARTARATRMPLSARWSDARSCPGPRTSPCGRATRTAIIAA